MGAIGRARQRPTKVGVINVQVAITSTAEGKQAAAELQSKFAPRQTELDNMRKQLDDLQTRLRTGQTTLSDDEKARLAREGDVLTRTYQRKQQEAQDDFNDEQQEVVNRIGRKMMDSSRQVLEGERLRRDLRHFGSADAGGLRGQPDRRHAGHHPALRSGEPGEGRSASSAAPPAAPRPAAPKPATPRPSRSKAMLCSISALKASLVASERGLFLLLRRSALAGDVVCACGFDYDEGPATKHLQSSKFLARAN